MQESFKYVSLICFFLNDSKDIYNVLKNVSN